MLTSLLFSALLTAVPGHAAAADTLDPATSPPAKAHHADRGRRGTVEYTGPVGREQHILGDNDDDETAADSTAHKPKRVRAKRNP